jgi:hypothetical protein
MTIVLPYYSMRPVCTAIESDKLLSTMLCDTHVQQRVGRRE